MFQKQPQEVFCEKDNPKNFAKFREKNLSQSLFLKKNCGSQACKLRLRHSCFPVNLEKILRTPFT